MLRASTAPADRARRTLGPAPLATSGDLRSRDHAIVAADARSASAYRRRPDDREDRWRKMLDRRRLLGADRFRHVGASSASATAADRPCRLLFHFSATWSRNRRRSPRWVGCSQPTPTARAMATELAVRRSTGLTPTSGRRPSGRLLRLPMSPRCKLAERLGFERFNATHLPRRPDRRL